MCCSIKKIVETLIGVAAGGYLTYLFTINAQKKDFLNQIKNTARIDISKNLKEYYTWLTRAKQLASNSWGILHTVGRSQREINRFEEECKANRFKFWEIIDRAESKEWIVILEEYNSLFPEYRTKRLKLISNHNEILKMLKLYVSNPDNKFDGKNISMQLDLISKIRIQLQDAYFKGLIKGKIINKNIYYDKG